MPNHDASTSNVNPSMEEDQFGIVGSLTSWEATEAARNQASIAHGTDQLPFDSTRTEQFYPPFGGLWTNEPLDVYENDYPVPTVLLFNSLIRDKLTQVAPENHLEDTIFIMFYMFPNDMLQIAAAIELYSREWRYHKEEKVWITRAPGIARSEKTNSYERGTYYMFDAQLWQRRILREFVLVYDLLEAKPTI